MPGFELFGDAERKEVKDVLDSGVLMRYGFDGLRKGQWKAKDLETEIEKRFAVQHAQLLSSGTAAVSMALAASGVGAGDEETAVSDERAQGRVLEPEPGSKFLPVRR